MEESKRDSITAGSGSANLNNLIQRQTDCLRVDQIVKVAIQKIVDSGLPALPVTDADGHYCGLFGEREFISALFPQYLGDLRSARFIPRQVDTYLEMQSACGDAPVSRYMNREHIETEIGCSDMQLAEIFIHHDVLVIPIVNHDRRVTGVVTRHDFFKALVKRFAELV